MEYYSAIKREWNHAICSNMDGPRDYHTKWSESDRERQIPYDITYMWNLKIRHKWTILRNRSRLTDREQTCGCQGVGCGEGWIGSLGLAAANYIYRNG